MSESSVMNSEAERAALLDVPVQRLDGAATTLGELPGDVFLVVNVASECGLTPQYAGLQRLSETYAARGLTVVGCPCNQFGAQEPGTPEQIGSFCTSMYGVTFPLLSKLEVNGPSRHPLFETLSESSDADGHNGDIRWNFEKFLVSREAGVVARFAPTVEPEADVVVSAIEANLQPTSR